MRGNPYYVGPFTGGLNTRDSVLDVPYSFTPDAENVIAGVDGVIRKRDPHLAFASGFTGAGSNDLTGVFFSATQSALLTMANGHMYVVSSNGTFYDASGAATVPTNSLYSMVEAPTNGGQGPVYMLPADVTTTPQQWTSSPSNIGNWTASAGTLDKGDHMVFFKNRIIMCGLLIGTSGCGLKASAVGNPRDWDTSLSGASVAWLTNIDPTDGDRIYAMGTVGNYLIAFKQNKAYVIYDLDTGANRPLQGAPGCISKRSVVNTPYGLLWLAPDGHVYLTDGAKVQRLSDVVAESRTDPVATPFTLGLSVANTSDASGALNNPAAFYYNSRYYLSSGAIAANQARTWVYDFHTKSWWRNTGSFSQAAEAPAFTSGVDASPFYGARRSGSPGSGSAAIWNLFAPGTSAVSGAWQDGGSNFTAYYTTPPLAPARGKSAMAVMRRRFHAMRTNIAGSVDIQVALDQLDQTPSPTYTTVLSVATGTSLSRPTQQTATSLGVGNVLRLKFTSSDNKAFAVESPYLFTVPRAD